VRSCLFSGSTAFCKGLLASAFSKAPPRLGRSGGAGIGTTSRVPRSTSNLSPGLRNRARPAERSMSAGLYEPASCRRTVVSRPKLDRWHRACSQKGKTVPRKVVKISLLGESRSPWVPESAFEQPSPKLLRRL
jgi:hypothetical protein